MGSGESTTRKVSFGVDDEDRVRILRGVKLSEDVLQRMRGVANIAPERKSSSTSSPQTDTGVSHSSSSGSQPEQSPQPQPQSHTQSSKPASYTKDEHNRSEQQQTILKDKLAKVAQREREEARQEITKAMIRERQRARQDAEKTKQLVQRLQKKDSQLKVLDAFYKEQLEQLEKRNLEQYEQSKEKFHQAANVMETNVGARNTEAVCPDLQAQILSCYKENRDQTLRCSDLAKEYMKCINDAKKNLLVNHG
ncbi:MICOS complex subunit mic25a isoform X2 [Mugil cephalus]|uniref:MICOS complex subunit mic25a isoform X2 n=1 Tax=Mugil cephalus TaxID=48193 RepID=UPI001FB702C3|nr:MICOS complex subunit mic25a isoform X2 [Mugil cephalus]